MTDWRDRSLADIIRLLAALEQHGGAQFVQGLIDRVPLPEGIVNSRVTLGSIQNLLTQTGGSTILEEDVVAFMAAKIKPEASPEARIEYGTILSIESGEIIPPTPEDFEQIGTHVRIRHDSIYAHQNDKEGVITKNSPNGYDGWVEVDFGNNSNNYRTGRVVTRRNYTVKCDGTCDLELVNPRRSQPSKAVVTLNHSGFRTLVTVPENFPIKLELGDLVMINSDMNEIIIPPDHSIG